MTQVSAISLRPHVVASLGGVWIFVVATLLTSVAQQFGRPITAVLVYLVGVTLIAASSGLIGGLTAAAIASLVYNFFLSEPALRFGFVHLDHLVPLVAFNLSAIASGAIAGRLKDGARKAHFAETRNAFLLQVSDGLQRAIELVDVERIARDILPIHGLSDLEIFIFQGGRLFSLPVQREVPIEGLAGTGDPRGESASRPEFRVLELRGREGVLGLVKFHFAGETTIPQETPDLQALANLFGLAIDRCMLLEKVAENRALARSEQLKSAILCSVSHDLRTPLTAIKTSTDRLRAYDASLAPQERARMLLTIDQQCEKLDRYTSDLLDLGRIEAGLNAENARAVDLLEIVGVSLRTVRLRHPDQKIEKEFEVDEAIVSANDIMLEQAISNLLENAIVHGDASEPISVALACREASAILSITDRGAGIALADQSRIFEKFYRTTGSTDRGGNGLGLYIANSFIRTFDGEIEVQSPVYEGRGTRVTIRLPLAEAASKAEAVT